MQIDTKFQVSPYLLLFIIVASQVGVGMLSFQRNVTKEAGYDGWISVLLAGMGIQILMFVMYKLVSAADGDIIHIHQIVWGKYIGGLFSLIIMLYFALISLSVLRSYIEIVQVWMFPSLPSWIVSSILMLLVYYIISSGFRVVVGICFFSVIFPMVGQLPLFIFPIPYYHMDNLLPVLDHSFWEIISGIKGSIYTMAGFEVILMIYPFIRKNQSSQRYAHLGILLTTVLYTMSVLNNFLFFSENQIRKLIWPELTLSKLIHFSFLERFEYIYISMYMLVIIALLAIFLWCGSRGLKLVFGVKQKYPLLILLLFNIAGCQFLTDSESITAYQKWVSYLHLGLFYVYIPILWMILVIWKRSKVV